MRQAFKQRVRSSSLSAVAPSPASPDYSPAMAASAASILYQSPLPSPSGHPVYVLNAAALPDTHDVDYDTLLPYVLARLPGEEDLIHGTEYEVVFFAGGSADSATSGKKGYPGVGWVIQAYHVLSRAMRKRIQRLYIVHERKWVRMLVEVFSTIASPKFRKKIVHAATLTQLAQHIDITGLLIPPSAYLRDRELSPSIHVANASGRRAFSARPPLPMGVDGKSRLPRVLRETSSFLLMNLHMEGLFRVPAHVKQKDILREAYDRGQKFIVWKERDVYLPLRREANTLPRVNMDTLVKEIDQTEAYGVHLAAGLCKFWYSELRDPLFPRTSYKDLMRLYGDSLEPITLEKLTELLSPKSEWSILSATSREILTRHLLPLLAAVAARSEENKMTPDNLAVCFAPTLCCGTDPIEDAKASSIIRRVLTEAIEQWLRGLREACGMDANTFIADLQPPAREDDYEDPLPVGSGSSDHEEDEKPTSSHGFTDEQETGILLRDNDIQDAKFATEDAPPPLPPRQQLARLNISPPTGTEDSASSSAVSSLQSPRVPSHPSAGSDTSLRRKEVPRQSINTQLPPRYSQAIAQDEVTESPSSYITPANGFAPRRPGDWSFDTNEPDRATEIGRKDSQIRRKPVGSGSEGFTPISGSSMDERS
ncbi:uncharacterized protein PV09_03871 [Verruconis gallopava]|uniref:Rho-GAP domain-containing protein n=1 Tax=Verruconis gallopava TaxID=253628 RepID=A0A0D2AFT1_9PEZI|nr:uncharacterized protein PV09_03871 [Verruconis gallopava]KIW05355.1 hypothetical protein PV09_03871 [Verruconis gallopava]